MSDLLEFDPVMGIRRGFTYNHADESFIIDTQQEVTSIIEDNKALSNMIDERANWKGDFHRVASIPMVKYMELVQKGIAHDNKAILRWLDEPEQRYLKTRPGRLSR
jgi:hypothetical protein